MNASQFLRQLRSEIQSHPALSHPVLDWLARTAASRSDFLAFGLQHYALVSNFVSYMEELLVTAPDSQSKLWLAKVLVDEYGEGSDGQDHATIYRRFLAASGAQPGEEQDVPLHADVFDFVRGHQDLCRTTSFLEGLGALGPGHEWSIPRMFEPVVAGLRRVGYAEPEILYFTLHQEQDVHPGAWLEEALELCLHSEADATAIRRGTLRSLAMRERFWSGIQDKIEAFRRGELTPLAPRAAEKGEARTLRQLQSVGGQVVRRRAP